MGTPLVLAAITLCTALTLDSGSMCCVVLLWCIVWPTVLLGGGPSHWSVGGQRLSLAVGAGWIGLWLVMALTVSRVEMDTEHELLDHATAGWPYEVVLGLVPPLDRPSREVADQRRETLTQMGPPPLTPNGPSLRGTLGATKNLLVWTLVGFVLAMCVPRHHLRLALVAMAIAAPAAPLTAQVLHLPLQASR